MAKKPRLVLIKSTDIVPIEFYLKSMNRVMEESMGYKKYLFAATRSRPLFYWVNIRTGQSYYIDNSR